MSVASGFSALRAGRHAEARRLAESRLASEPADMTARLLLARALEAGGALDQALAAIERVDTRHVPAAVADRARMLARAGRNRAACEICAEAVRVGQLRDPAVLNALGEVAGRLGDLAVAEACFRAAAATNFWPARYNLGLALAQRGALGEAHGLFESVTRAAPRFAAGWLQLGGALNAAGRYQEAVAAFRRHLELAPASALGWAWLGASFQYLGDLAAAERAYRTALAHDPDLADARANLGRLLQSIGQGEAAEEQLTGALRRDPDHVVARAGLAARMERQGRFEEALELLAGSAPETRLHRSRLYRRLARHDAALAELKAVADDPGAPADARRQAAFSTAQALDEAGRYPAAEALLRQANADRYADWLSAGWNPDQEIARLESAATDLENVFGGNRTSLPRSDLDGTGAVFVVGMPRAGKSLLEQALAAHPEVAAAGELTALGDIAAELPEWPLALANLTPRRLTDAGRRYLDAAGTSAPRVLDTLPFNFLNAGLASLLLPGSRIIALHRNAADLALRCLFKNFAGRRLAFTNSPALLARWIRVYDRVMTVWRNADDVSLHEVRYEDLVQRPEDTLRGALAFLGLSWDARVLDFHRADVSMTGDRPALEPLHGREIGAWRHYTDLLQPILAIVGEPGP
jgi:tetratricopeptide (TPR) repeat protein